MSIDLDAIEAMTSDPYQYAQVSPEVTRGYLAALVTEVHRLRAVAAPARELMRLLDAGIGDYDIPGEALESALDALDAGGEGS